VGSHEIRDPHAPRLTGAKSRKETATAPASVLPRRTWSHGPNPPLDQMPVMPWLPIRSSQLSLHVQARPGTSYPHVEPSSQSFARWGGALNPGHTQTTASVITIRPTARILRSMVRR
jgi:hypothetical protein